AAEVLNVSRPYLVERLEEGEIPFRKVGSHRRIRLQDVLEYKRAQKEESRRRLEELAAEDERLDIDY
ncbi:MAG: excisionase family DNA-binding protein, partial [Bradymonadaceae bacterium]